jgi:hypothetical protein
MQTKIKYIYLGLLAGILVGHAGTSYATLTDAEENAILDGAPYAQRSTTDFMWPSDASSTAVDRSKLGTAIKTTGTAGAPGTSVAFYVDASNYAYCDSTTGGVWSSFKSTALTDLNATTGIVFTEFLKDGVDPAGSAHTITVTFTKSAAGSPKDLTVAVIAKFLRGTSTRNLSTITGTGTPLAAGAGSTLTTGWTATAIRKDSTSAAQATVLDDAETGYTLPITGNGETAANFVTTVTCNQFNQASGGTTDIEMNWVCPTNARSLSFNVRSGTISDHSNPISTSLLTAINTYTGRRVAIKSTPNLKTFCPPITSVIAALKATFVTTDDASLQAKMAAAAKNNLLSADMVIGDFTTTADTNKYGLVMAADTDLTSVTWSNDGPVLIATGKVGVTSFAEEFKCDLTGKLIVKDDTNYVLELASDYGRSLFIKAFDSTGLDMTAVNTYGADFRSTLLAAALVNAISATTTVAHKAVDAIHH